MVSEIKQHREEIARQTTLGINWPGSKRAIAEFTRAALNCERNRDEEFLRAADGAESVVELIYDLGHRERGLDDFSHEIPLIVPVINSEINRPNLVYTMSFPQFYDQITTRVAAYMAEPFRKSLRPGASQKEIGILRALTEQLKGKNIKVTFGPVLDGIFEITQMETDEYRFPDA